MSRSALALATVAILAAACTPGPTPGGGGPARATSPPPPQGVFRMQGCEPRSLLPAGATTPCGQQVVSALYTPLVELDPADGTPQWGTDDDRAVADEISTSDGRRWTIVLEEGWEFHDGSPVTAQSFVDAWNFAALETNAQPNGWLLDPIAGFDRLRCNQAGCVPEGERLSGARAWSDRVLEVVLDHPDRDFPRLLGHPALAPLPRSAIDDPEAFEQEPRGNGPLRIEGAWEHNELIRLRRVEEGHAGRPAASAGLDLVLYREPGEARDALVDGAIDLAAELAPEHAPDPGQDLTTVSRDGDDYEFLVVPAHRPELSDPRLAEALSLAIDRSAIIETDLGGMAEPADGVVPPVAGLGSGQCGDACGFDPERARTLLEQVDLPARGLELWYDRTTDHGRWVEAVMAQWRQHLDLAPDQARLRSLPHDQYLAHLVDRRVAGLYALGWSMDLPTPEEYLGELHGASGLFNFDGYRAPGLDRRLVAARNTAEPEERQRLHRESARLVLDDWHHVPLWVHTHWAVHGPGVDDVELDPWGRVLLDRVRVVDD